MASCDSSDNPNKLKIAGIGEGYLKKLKEKYGISDHYDILERFKSFEDEIWGVSGPDIETRAFIDKLLFVIHAEICYPSGKILKDSLNEITNANQLAKEVKETIKEIKDDENNETILGKTMEKLEQKFKNIGNHSTTFNNFVCCLLMSEFPKSSNVKQDEIKANLFTGVFQSWNLLKKLGQVEDTQLKEILFINEENKKPIIESIVNRKRAKQIERGFNKIIEFINESKNIPIKELDRFCEKEEAIQNSFYKWFIDSDCKIKTTDFTNSYVNIKREYLPNFDEYTDLNNNFINHLQWEIKEIQESFHFLNLLPPTLATENVVSNLQKQLLDLWKQVKDNVNEVEKWNRLVMEHSNKGTLQSRNLHEVPCSLDKLKCLQVNLNRSEKAWNQVVGKWLNGKKKRHIVFIQEPCIKKMEITRRQDIKKTNKKDYCYYFPNLPTDYRAIHNIYLIDKEDQELANVDDDAKSRSGERIHISAILVHKDVSFERILPMAPIHDNYPQELMAGIRLTGQGWNGVTFFSIYCRPIRSLAMVLKPLRLLLGNHDMTPTILCMDANATHPNWSPAHENKGLYSGRGEDLEYFFTSCKLKVANQNFKNVKKENTQPTRDDTENEPEPDTENKKEKKPKHIDVTFNRGDHLCIENWKRLPDKSLSDHRYITFSIKNYGEDAKKSSPHLSSCLGRNKVSARSPDAEV